MTKKTRTILFLIFLILFLLIAPLTILYSQGYRIDIENKKITQTGGLFLKIIPKQAEIYLNGKLTKKTDFFFGSALIENLLPKKYKIEVKKEGYSSWEKSLEIREKEVTEAKNIVLFPKNINFEILLKNVGSHWVSPDGKKIILYEKASPEGPGWALKLYDLEKNLKSHLINEDDISPKSADLVSLEWAQDSKEIFLEVGIEERLKYFAVELDKIPPVLTEKTAPSLPSENIIASQLINGKLYLLDKLGQLFKNGERLTQKSFPVKSETEYTLEVFSDFIFLREGENLYQFDSDSKSFEKFFEDIKGFKISPDNKKMVYFSDSEIWVFFMKEIANQPKRTAGERLFLIRLSEKIKDAFWLNPDYLIFNAGNKIKIAEIDDRDRINIVDVSELPPTTSEKEETSYGDELQSGGGLEMFFSQNSKKIYILSNGNLYTSSEPLL